MNRLRLYSNVPLLLRLAIMLVFIFVGLQDVQAYEVEYTNIKVCNTGNVKFLVAVVKADWNLFGGDFRGDGWYGVDRGRCKGVDYRSQPGTYYLTFIQYDSDGNPGIATYRPGSSSGIFKESGWSFCVKLKNFEYEESGRPTQDCPSPYFLAPFPFSIWRVPGQNDLSIDIPATSSARLVAIPGYKQKSPPAKQREQEATPVAPAPPAPPPPPKKPGWIGITVIDMTPMGAKIGAFLGGTLGNQNTLEEKRDAGEAWGKEFFGGLQIESVADGSPAMKSGLLKGDRIKTVIYDIFKECTPKDIPELRACTKERLINSRFHEAICFSVDQDGPSAGNPLVRERLSRIPPPSGGPRPVRTPVR